jgi:cytochrome c biogenesis protein CcdA/thiol-disulfide isomerase/thioredoxin
MALLILTYLAGVLTILSPCILPVLPFVFGKARGSFLKNGVPLLVGMALTFSLFSGLALAGGEWISRTNDIGRVLAMSLMVVFGLSLVFPHVFELVLAPLSRPGFRIGQNARNESPTPTGSLLVGVSTGLLWAPCAGPILGLVLTGAATRDSLGSSVGLLLSYSMGAATSLALALVAGSRVSAKLKSFLGVDKIVKKSLGLAVLLGVAMIAFNLDRTILTRLSKLGTESVEQKLLRWAGLNNPNVVSEEEGAPEASMIEGLLPEFDGAVSWLNSPPLDSETLRGKVVLVDFWTYSCINCLRTLPYLRSWHEKYKGEGLVIIGVHTPEFAFERKLDNVQKAVEDLGIKYPIAIDNNYKIWGAFKNRYWPAHYFVDRLGRIRHRHFGEGEYESSESMLRKLLGENGIAIKTIESKDELQISGIEASGSRNVQSPETYVGYGRAANFVSNPGFVRDQAADYKSPAQLSLNQWSLGGRWGVEKERAVAKGENGRISYRFKARDLHLVLGGVNIPFVVKIDGHAPGQSHGLDTDESGRGRVHGHRLYQLIRQRENDSKEDHVFEIEFLKPGVEAYAFTFG